MSHTISPSSYPHSLLVLSHQIAPRSIFPSWFLMNYPRFSYLYVMIGCLVVSNMNLFSIIYGIILPID
jgi:hypothetical protein